MKSRNSLNCLKFFICITYDAIQRSSLKVSIFYSYIFTTLFPKQSFLVFAFRRSGRTATYRTCPVARPLKQWQ